MFSCRFSLCLAPQARPRAPLRGQKDDFIVFHPSSAGIELKWRFRLFFVSCFEAQLAPKLQSLMRKQAFDSSLPAPVSSLIGLLRISLCLAPQVRPHLSFRNSCGNKFPNRFFQRRCRSNMTCSAFRYISKPIIFSAKSLNESSDSSK